jgi:hypothetical protein
VPEKPPKVTTYPPKNVTSRKTKSPAKKRAKKSAPKKRAKKA